MTETSTARVYVGTYTQRLPHVNGTAEGVYLYELDLATGALHRRSTAGGVVNPSFVTLAAAGRRLYAVQEVGEYEGQPGGAVSAFAVDEGSGALMLLNSQPTHGAHPCFVSVDRSGRWALVANYSGANVTVLPIGDDGALGPPASVTQHHGTPTHHDAPHPHSIVSAGDHVLVPDCGLDMIAIYRLDAATGALAPAHHPRFALAAGAGPRHLAFHPSRPLIYCINERNSTVTALSYDAEAGALHALQTLSTLPAGFEGGNSTADIHVHPSGRFLYGTNRGHNSLARFTIGDDGLLTPAGHASTQGKTPRNFAIDPTGALLLAANQDSDSVVSFRIDQDTGALTPLATTAVPSPVCLCFA
jgi:6-phosphogluconolactonase